MDKQIDGKIDGCKGCGTDEQRWKNQKKFGLENGRKDKNRLMR